MFKPKRYSTLPTRSQVRIFFRYEVTTPLSSENIKTLSEILGRDDIRIVSEMGIMGTKYYGIKDSTGKMLCFAESELFDRPCESYRICFGDYHANTDEFVEIANLNCWYKDVSEDKKIKSVRKKTPEKQILEMYNKIRLCLNNKHR